MPPAEVEYARYSKLGAHLARFVIIAVLAAALPAVLSTLAVSPTAAPMVETPPPELSRASATVGAETKTMAPHSLDPAVAAGSTDAPPQPGPAGEWFDDRELKLSATGGDKTDLLIDPNACVYPDSFLRNLAGGRDDCGFLRPGPDQSEIFTLPFLALSAWVLVICAVAALHHFRRKWRLQPWLRRMQAQGFAPGLAPGSAPGLAPISTYPRRSPYRRSRRSSRHGRATSRRYAG